jgi:SET domain-containing protein 6
MRGAGITWAKDAIRLRSDFAYCTGLSLGIAAVRDVGEGEVLATIPKAAVISIVTSSIADILEAEGLKGGLGATVALLHELSLEEESKW